VPSVAANDGLEEKHPVERLMTSAVSQHPEDAWPQARVPGPLWVRARVLQSPAPFPPGMMPAPEGRLPIPELQSHPALRPVAQLWNSYLLAEGPAGLLVIDQHLAHERVLFDRLQAAGSVPGAPGVTSQRLAAPLTLQLSHREALAVAELLPELAAVGIELEAFGRDAYVVRAVPAFVKPGAELTTLRGLLDELSAHPRGGVHAGEGAPPPRLPDRIAATTACKAAIKKGARLAPEEIARLLEDLSRVENPHTCPHGCPIAVEISYQELLRRFKRI
jgi:DNA mismatch repair protein MutL